MQAYGGWNSTMLLYIMEHFQTITKKGGYLIFNVLFFTISCTNHNSIEHTLEGKHWISPDATWYSLDVGEMQYFNTVIVSFCHNLLWMLFVVCMSMLQSLFWYLPLLGDLHKVEIVKRRVQQVSMAKNNSELQPKAKERRGWTRVILFLFLVNELFIAVYAEICLSWWKLEKALKP